MNIQHQLLSKAHSIKYYLIAIALLFFISQTSQAQTENTILNHQNFDDFIGYQFLSDTGIRIVTRSNQFNAFGSPGCAATDYHFKDPLHSLTPEFIHVPGHYINGDITELYMVPLRDGNTLLA